MHAMILRLRLMLVTSAVVLFLFGISGWLSYRHTAALLEQHEAILVETADHAVALAATSTRHHGSPALALIGPAWCVRST